MKPEPPNVPKARLACAQVGIPIPHTNQQVVVHVPCQNPKPNCPKPPSGPGSGHVGTIPYTNNQVHVAPKTQPSK